MHIHISRSYRGLRDEIHDSQIAPLNGLQLANSDLFAR